MITGHLLKLKDEPTGATIEVAVADLVIAGWTGRDAAAVEAHIAELEAIGVPRPASVPCFYRVAAALLTTAEEIQAPGPDSSGEVEFVLFGAADGMRVGVGSDHTDRRVETYDITVSKQMCFKPVAPAVWRVEDVADHWDELVLRSWATTDGEKRLYQEGKLAAMRDPADLIGRWAGGGDALPPGVAMFCGTHAVHGGVAAADRFDFELADPVLDRAIRHGYAIKTLPMVEKETDNAGQ